MKFKEKLSQIKNRRLILIAAGVVLLIALALTLFLKLKPVKIPPYNATYQVDTQVTFGDINNYQTEKVIVSRLDNLYKSERFVNDIGLLASTHNTPDGFILCSQNENFDCKRLGSALTKNVGRPPKVEGLKISSPIAQKINIVGQDRPCRETTYTLSDPDKNASIQDLTASVCIDNELQIPLIASFTAHYRVNDITEIKDLTVEQTRYLTNINTSPNLSPSDFTAPTAKN